MVRKQTHAQKWQKKLEEEFLAAYDANTDALYRHCFIRVRDRDAAKDIVQETFSKTWLYLSEGKEIEHIRAFLYRVANNLIVDASRKKKSASLDSMMEEDGYEVVDDSIRAPIDRPAVKSAMKHLRALEEMYRTVITMRFIDELSLKEIAHALNVSENVVSVRIFRGIVHLRALMGEGVQKA